jgi:DNA-binding MarR family transcriptional regulator
LEEALRKKIKIVEEEIRRKANEPEVRAYTGMYLTYDIIDEYANRQLDEHRVTRAGQNILRILIMNGGSMIATEISKQVWRSKFSVTKVIDTLETNGYVIRDNSETNGDRRKKIISITEKGLELSTKVIRISEGCLCKEVMRGLNQQQLDVFYETLLHIGKNTFDLINDSDNSYLFRLI